jgi:hypothetical protein
LLAGVQVDDTESAVAQTGVLIEIITFTVGAAMMERPSHAPEEILLAVGEPTSSHHSRYATHIA